MPTGDGVVLVTREQFRQRRLARAVRAHDRVHFAGVDAQRNAAEDFLAVDAGVNVLNIKHGVYGSGLMPWL